MQRTAWRTRARGQLARARDKRRSGRYFVVMQNRRCRTKWCTLPRHFRNLTCDMTDTVAVDGRTRACFALRWLASYKNAPDDAGRHRSLLQPSPSPVPTPRETEKNINEASASFLFHSLCTAIERWSKTALFLQIFRWRSPWSCWAAWSACPTSRGSSGPFRHQFPRMCRALWPITTIPLRHR